MLPNLVRTMVLVGLVVAGCDRRDRGRVTTYPTYGSITFAGEPIAGAFLALHPRSPADGTVPQSTAHVQNDGTFHLSTYETGDGAPTGDYVLTVQWHKLINADGDSIPGPNLLPAKYSSPTTSDIVLHIGESPTELPAIDLKRNVR